MINLKLQYLNEKSRNLPSLPGVYLMKNSKEEIIYIGKAKSLKNRVSNYFQSSNATHNPKVVKMISKVNDFDYIITDSEFEALVLECSLIKQNKPKYNILLKDDKGYHYIKISNEDYPRISAKLQLEDGNDTFLGPFTSSFTVKQTVDETNKIFMLPTCNRKFPADFNKERPCLSYHIKHCMGVCKGNIKQQDYNEMVGQAVAYIKKGSDVLVKRLMLEMEKASNNLEFEKAANIRDRISSIKKITQKQKVIMIGNESQDVVAFAQNEDTITATIFKFRNSQLIDTEDFTFKDVYGTSKARFEFLSQYYLLNQNIPAKILIEEEFEEIKLLEAYLKKKYNPKFAFVIPKKGEQKQILDMVYKNASDKLAKQLSKTSREVAGLEELKKILNLPTSPEYIEAYDISNLGDSFRVGGMVTFLSGKPYKKGYKRFKIKNVIGQDDYASMKEVIERRFSHYNEEKSTEKGFGRLPDLILLDGSKGHVNSILPILLDYGLNIPIFGMVKDSKHKTRAISSNDEEIQISSNRAAFSLVTNIQEEVHRFAIAYQKKLHKKSTFSLELTKVDGIGNKKARDILLAFKGKIELKKATVQELMKVAKINEQTANILHDFIKNM